MSVGRSTQTRAVNHEADDALAELRIRGAAAGPQVLAERDLLVNFIGLQAETETTFGGSHAQIVLEKSGAVSLRVVVRDYVRSPGGLPVLRVIAHV